MRLIHKMSGVLMLCMMSILASYAASEAITQVENPLGSRDKFKHDLEIVGITYTQSGENLVITMNEQKTLDALGRLQSAGIVSKPDTAIVNIAPLSVSVVIAGMASTITILNSVFERTTVDKVIVNGYVIPLNSQTSQPCFSFDYDRKAFEALNLSILTPKDFLLNAPHFTFSAWCRNNLDAEAAQLKNK